MEFEACVDIACSSQAAFAFLRDKHDIVQAKRSPVLAIEKATAGPVGVGSRFHEVVRLLPGVHGAIVSEVTCCEPCRRLEEDYVGAGMRGHLAYELVQRPFGCRLLQRQTLEPQGPLKLLSPVIAPAFGRRLQDRLLAVKGELEMHTARLDPSTSAKESV